VICGAVDIIEGEASREVEGVGGALLGHDAAGDAAVGRRHQVRWTKTLVCLAI
jgi:hypothetical protein